MARLIWSEQAIVDVDETCTYLARTSLTYATNFASQVRAVALSAADQPLAGAVVPEYGSDDIRERLCHNHRVIYRVRADEVEILTVHLATRRLPRTPPG